VFHHLPHAHVSDLFARPGIFAPAEQALFPHAQLVSLDLDREGGALARSAAASRPNGLDLELAFGGLLDVVHEPCGVGQRIGLDRDRRPRRTP